MSKADVLALVPDFELDDLTAAFFGGNRLSSYDMDFRQADAKLIAIEVQDLVNAVKTGSKVAVPGKLGLDAVALVYSILESGEAERPVSFSEVVDGTVNKYQREIDDHAGL